MASGLVWPDAGDDQGNSFMDQPSSAAAPAFDIGDGIDNGAWTGWQKRVVLLVATAIILDGFDNQILGFVAPVLLKQWGITRDALAPVFAAGFLGMVVGAMGGGFLGDRIGRRPALIGSVLLFGLATGLTALAQNLSTLGLLRAFAGLGLGGAMPNAATLLAEFAPRRWRSLSVTLGIVCIPLGGVGGGFVAAALLPSWGWTSLFIVGGIAPFVVAALLAVALPESPRFLVQRPARRAELVAMLRRMGHQVDAATTLVERAGAPVPATLRSLFSGGLAADTSLLWAAFLACLLTTYVVFSWAPTLLTEAGLGIALASVSVATFNIGGVAGAVAAALLVPLVGSRLVLLANAAAGIATAILLALFGHDAGTTGLLALLAVEGACINAVQTSLYGLASHIYPTHQRSTGIGAASGFGRTGAIASSFVGAAVMAGGWNSFFLMLAGGMAVTFAALALVRRHSQPEPPANAPTPPVAMFHGGRGRV